MYIILGIYLISWIMLYVIAIDKNPIVTFKKGLRNRGLLKMIKLHLIIPIMFLNVVLQGITKLIGDCIDGFIE